MTNGQRPPWGAMIVAAGLVAGCGGGSGDGGAQTTESAGTTTTQSIAAGGNVNPVTGANKAIAPEDYYFYDMQGFRSFGYHTYANSSLKLLISAIGPKKLLDHLESFRTTAQDPAARAAAARFIELIHAAYTASASVDTHAFIVGLQELAPFNQRNAAGEWAFKLESDAFSREQDALQFLALLSQLFRLDTLPGWSFDIDETYVHQGQERKRKAEKSRFQLFQPVDLGRIKAEDVPGVNLQKLVDLLHAPQEAQIRWNEADPAPTTVQVTRQVSIPDEEHFDRLTISLQGKLAGATPLSIKGSVTLPAVSQKTGQRLLLTLRPKEVLVWDQWQYAMRIRNHELEWMKHSESTVYPADAEDPRETARLVNFAVTRIAPAP